jgi:hypothetical protein
MFLIGLFMSFSNLCLVLLQLANVLVYLFLNEIIGRFNGNSVDYYMIR